MGGGGGVRVCVCVCVCVCVYVCVGGVIAGGIWGWQGLPKKSPT